MPLGAFKAALMGTAGVSTTGDVVLLSTQTASNAATVSITSGIDSTYGEYIIKVYAMNPATNDTHFSFQGSIDGGSNYNVAITSTFFLSSHYENDSATDLTYNTGNDQAQGTGFQNVNLNLNSQADDCLVGELHLFNPSSTTYVKHFTSKWSGVTSVAAGEPKGANQHSFVAGYFNTTDNIDALQFKMASGNFDAKIKMWGVK